MRVSEANAAIGESREESCPEPAGTPSQRAASERSTCANSATQIRTYKSMATCHGTAPGWLIFRGGCPRKRGGAPRRWMRAAGGDASESAPKDHELLDDETVVDETDLARFQLHLCRLNNEDPLGLDAAHAVHDVLRRRPAIHELLSEALGGSSRNRRAKLSSRQRPGRFAKSRLRCPALAPPVPLSAARQRHRRTSRSSGL